MRSIKSALICAALLFLSFLMGAGARADSSWPFYQISCVPQLHYFVIRSFSLEDSPLSYGEEGDFKKLIGTDVFTAEGLQNKPFLCQTGEGLEVRVEATAGRYNTATPCAGSVTEHIRVFANGYLVGSLAEEGDCYAGVPGADTVLELSASRGGFIQYRRLDHSEKDEFKVDGCTIVEGKLLFGDKSCPLLSAR